MNPNSQLIIYQAEDGQTKLEVRLEDETVWLTQAQMSQLFGKGRTTITEHIRNIFEEGELQEEVVCRKFRHTTQHGAIAGKTQEIEVYGYNLDVIISVNYPYDKKNTIPIRKNDVSIAKNYLNEDEIKLLGLLIWNVPMRSMANTKKNNKNWSGKIV